jgi:hypothetical protein
MQQQTAGAIMDLKQEAPPPPIPRKEPEIRWIGS